MPLIKTPELTQKYLLIIASYWSAECAYNNKQNTGTRVYGYISDKILYYLRYSMVSNFKLYLRPLWSITEKELMSLIKDTGLKSVKVEVSDRTKWIVAEKGNGVIFGISKSSQPNKIDHFSLPWAEDFAIETVNWLREHNFCVDQKLLDAGLVEWKEVKA